MSEARDRVRRQFGINAAHYLSSEVHARGASLSRIVELMAPQPHWRLLDVATAAGHTALAFAPHVEEVVATDLVDEMLDLARQQVAVQGVGNVRVEPADAEALPFENASFDAVTCRIASHHFAEPERFVAEVARVLRPGGQFGLVDNMVPVEASAFVNTFESKRDPSHVRALAMDEWLAMLDGFGLNVHCAEMMAKRMNFHHWVENMSVADDRRKELLADLEGVSDEAAAYLRPEFGQPGDQRAAAFFLTEGVVVASRR